MRKKSRILIFTGDGKGKTTATLGMALRACGHGLKTLIVQFIKGNPSIGEIEAIKHLPDVELIQMGRGITPPVNDPTFQEHRRAAQAALKMVLQALTCKRYDLYILDEVCTALGKELLDEDQVVELLMQGDEDSCIVLTGRGAKERLLLMADTVTEMRCLKHGLHEGWTAQRGVEY